jgi:hypothetical protein
LVGGAVASHASFSVTTLPSDWTTGITSDSGTYTNTLLFPIPNPQLFGLNKSFVAYGNNVTTGPTGSDTFTAKTAHLVFDVTHGADTAMFTGTGTLNGAVSFNGTAGNSTATVTFTSLNGSTTTGTDPFTGNPDSLIDKTVVGKTVFTVYLDVNQGLAAPITGAPASVAGGVMVSAIPELGTSVSLGAMLLGGCLFGRRIRRRNGTRP